MQSANFFAQLLTLHKKESNFCEKVYRYRTHKYLAWKYISSGVLIHVHVTKRHQMSEDLVLEDISKDSCSQHKYSSCCILLHAAYCMLSDARGQEWIWWEAEAAVLSSHHLSISGDSGQTWRSGRRTIPSSGKFMIQGKDQLWPILHCSKSVLRYSKMVEWMDNVEMAISKVCASKVYTSAEFKREKDNFQSLCKNLERAETKK